MSQIELDLHSATVEALVRLDPKDPRRQDIEAMAHAVNGFKVELGRDAEWMRQANILADICVPILSTPRHSISRQENIENLPPFIEQSAEVSSLLPINLVVEARIPWLKFAEAAGIGIDEYLRSRIKDVKDWRGDPKRFKTPKKPYTTSVQDGTRFVNLKPFQARAQMVPFERGGNIFDIISYKVLRPEIVKGKGWDLIGWQVGPDRMPDLHWFGVRPRLYARWDDCAYPSFRALVCGRKIGT